MAPESDAGVVPVDAYVPPEPDCYPPWDPGPTLYTLTWSAIELVGLAFDADGSLLVAGRFVGSADLDPGPGTVPFSGDPSVARSFVARLDPAGALAWAQVLDERLTILDVTVTTSGSVAVTGMVQNDGRPAIDFDPGPGTAEQTLWLYDHGIYALALDRDGAFRWARMVTTRAAGSSLAGIDARSDGTLVVLGDLTSTTPYAWEPTTAPDAVPGLSLPFLWQLHDDGTTVFATPLPGSAFDFVHGPDDSLVWVGLSPLSWDADPTYGRDDHTGSVIGVLPGTYVTALGPDFTYRWTRSVDAPVSFGDVAVDSEGGVYVTGGVGNEHQPYPGDIDPTVGQRWMQAGNRFLARWTSEGAFEWANPPLSYADFVTAGERGSYAVANPGRIVAIDPAGRWRWRRTLEPLRIEHLELGPGGLVAAASGALDPHAAPWPPLADSVVTVFTDEGGESPRCTEEPLEELPSVLCTMTRAVACTDLPAECGEQIDPCTGAALPCGACVGPEVCGAEGVASECGREGRTVLAEGLAHPLHVAADDTYVYFTTQGDYGPISPPETSPVREALGVWRVRRDGSAAAERIYEERARPISMFVTANAIYVTVRESLTTGETRVVRISKSDPAAAAPDPVILGIGSIAGVDGDQIYYAGGTDLMRRSDGGGAATVFAPGCPSGIVVFHAGEAFYTCTDGATGLPAVRSRPIAGGAELVRTRPAAQLRLEHVGPGGITYSVPGFMAGSREWMRVPLVTSGSPPAATLLGVEYPDTDLAAYGPRVAFDGTDRWNLYPGALTAETREGQLATSPFDPSAPHARIAAHLDHPVSIAVDDRDVFVAEEGSLGMYARTGRIVRVPR